MTSMSPFVIVAQTRSAPTAVEMFFEAGPMAWAVFGILAFMSIVSWAIMISKILQYRKADAEGEEFLDIFRRSKRFSEVNAAAGRLTGTPMVGLFQAGYAEIDAQVKAAQEAAQKSNAPVSSFRVKSLEGVERSLRRAIAVEQVVLNRGTAFLATTASASPFIGLFGTVWGIMVAFNEIGATGSTSITAVAPGIAEALINTAAGLVAAIPALVGFNYFAARLRDLRSQMQDFVLEFMNLTERNFT
ncbi:MAG: MotA/TolQ/ExbB proton channel family protein [Acidobacteriota bacterium]